MGFQLRFFVCIIILGVTLYAYVRKHNELIEAEIAVPMLSKALQAVVEENVRLSFQIAAFENPTNLMELARKPEYSHLRAPIANEIITIEVEDAS